ncbi:MULTISPECIES: phosphonate degradation HD-domain oxygenase [unclassified Variovorax]|uniref:phosphonate degradation HD-domain oxygenase n=1 Tax=unclassified Variovorax TaxID=663243 RepID=UPI0013184BF6|nr:MULTISPECIES: phosphonate degradation HD-domain oxygenase [unclassified Variovorax]VTU45895.1 phosphonate degradation operons associated HDIG domain protein [Variovorax sp. PBL-E5]VTU46711.1 phosphonate degradation operons associated HDIG domain protein [Variovorax sp. SRS16]
MPLTVDEIASLLGTRGQRQYGREAVSQLDHALQCAQLAEANGETPETVVAALLHDLGHLLAAEPDRPAPPARDDLHQYIALPFLRHLLPAAVLEPIGLHVDAKRYLCAVDPGYHGTLSPASQRSLELQGGVYSAEEAVRFIEKPFAAEAVRLRRYDDGAKVPRRPTPELPHFIRTLARVSLR